MDIRYAPPDQERNWPSPEHWTLGDIQADSVAADDPPQATPSALHLPLLGMDMRQALLDLFDGAEDAYPQQLAQRFPHVMRRLEALWGSEDIYRFLDSLTPADADRCQGFPPDVDAEIRRLRSAYRTRYPDPAEGQPEAPEASAAADTVAETGEPAAAPSEADLDFDAWRSERRLRGWEARSVF